jgi:hypothetical protein
MYIYHKPKRMEKTRLLHVVEGLNADVLTVVVQYLNARQLLTLGCYINIHPIEYNTSQRIHTKQHNTWGSVFKCMLIQLLSRLHVGQSVQNEICQGPHSIHLEHFRRLFLSLANAMVQVSSTYDPKHRFVNLCNSPKHNQDCCLEGVKRLTKRHTWPWLHAIWTTRKHQKQNKKELVQNATSRVHLNLQMCCQLLMCSTTNVKFFPYITNVDDNGERRQYVVHRIYTKTQNNNK